MLKYNLKDKNIFKVLMIIIVFSCIIIPVNSYASDLQFNYTKEYLDWLNLSNEEKENRVPPQMISVSQKSSNERKFLE